MFGRLWCRMTHPWLWSRTVFGAPYKLCVVCGRSYTGQHVYIGKTPPKNVRKDDNHAR